MWRGLDGFATAREGLWEEDAWQPEAVIGSLPDDPLWQSARKYLRGSHRCCQRRLRYRLKKLIRKLDLKTSLTVEKLRENGY